EVEVWPRGYSGRADVADDLTLAHAHARLDAVGKPLHVSVGGLVSVGVADADIVAVLSPRSGKFDDPVAGRHDRGSRRAAPVDAVVHSLDGQDRVLAHAEAGGEAYVLAAHRPAHEKLARRAAFGVVEVDDAVRRAEAVELVGLAAGRDECRQQIAKLGVDA